MWDRFRERNVSSPEVIGAGLVFVGLILVLVVFFAVLPVLLDPVGTHDDWFPDDEVAAPADEATTEPEGPLAAFRFEAEASSGAFRVYTVRLEDRSDPGDAEVVSWNWDLGDGNEASGPVVEHSYREPGVYLVRLDIEDENGGTSDVETDVGVPEEGRSSGSGEAQEELDLSGLESAVEDAVTSLEGSVEDTLQSVVVVVLFALAAIATTVVGWRVMRTGVMLLRPVQGMNLKVRPADMHIEIDGSSLHHGAEAQERD